VIPHVPSELGAGFRQGEARELTLVALESARDASGALVRPVGSPAVREERDTKGEEYIEIAISIE